ncbi:MAG: hypothetical protein ABIY50_01280 [Ignavibacteria bacterium]
MKILTITFMILTGITFISCDKTNKQSSKSADTMVIKKDTAIKRTDTSGFNK